MDSYYSKYLKYKQKYLNLKKMIGGKNLTVFNLNQLITAINEYYNERNGFSQYCDEGQCKYGVRDIKKNNFEYYNSHLCVLKTDGKIYLGKLNLTSDEFKEFGITRTNIQFNCNLLYTNYRTYDFEEDYGKQHVLNALYGGDEISLIGFIPETDKDAILKAASDKRQAKRQAKKTSDERQAIKGNLKSK